MRAVVRKSPPVLVRPSEPVTMTGNIDLLPYDMAYVGMQNTAFLVFSEPIQDPAESLRKAMSRALVHYHPLSGRIVNGKVVCTGEGVLFVAATASSPVEDVRFVNGTMAARTLLDDLAVYYYPAGKPCAATDPLLLMQVTEFSCGGYVVGVTWNHGVADGAGIGQFVRAVGELARGLPSPSVVPVRWDDLVALPFPSFPVLDLIRRGLAVEPLEMPLLDITVPSSLVNNVRDACSSTDDDGRRGCTAFEAITAVLWQCRTRAVMSDPDAPTMLCFSVDLRRYAGIKAGYYGNCTAMQLAVATSGEVADGHIGEVVKVIQRAKDQIPDMLETKKQPVKQQHEEVLVVYNLFIVTCWRNLGLDEADFGGGTPARVLSYRQNLVGPPINIVTRNAEDGGSNVLSRCVKEEHAHVFLRELASFTI